MSDQRWRVLMAGPLPPAVGGMASVVAALASSSLSSRTSLALFDTGKQTPAGRSLLAGIVARIRLMSKWWRLLGRVKPGQQPLTHLHTCSGLTFFLDGGLLVLAGMRGETTVLHVHGARFDEFLDELAPPLRSMARWLARRAHVVVVLSDEWRERLSKRLPGANLNVVRNGVAPNTNRRTVSEAGAPRFLFLGNLCRRKGIHVLLQAAAVSRGNWALDLAGGEEEPGFTDWTRAEIARLGLAERVRLLGPVLGAAKADLLAGAAGFVLPSLAEGLPMALLEAMASKLPVVVTRVGAMPEVVRDEVEGLLVDPEDAPALAAALDRLANDAGLRARMGSVAEQTCTQRFGVETMVESLMTVYEQAAQRRPSP